MEGLSTVLIGFGMVAGLAVLFWAIFRFGIPSNALTISGMGLQIAKLVVQMMFPNDPEKQKKFIPIIELLIVGISEVDVSKKTIEATLPEGATDVQRHAAYTDEAIRIAEMLGKEQGITFDGVTKEILKTATRFILGFFRSRGAVTAPTGNILSDGLHGIEPDKDGIFRVSGASGP